MKGEGVLRQSRSRAGYINMCRGGEGQGPGNGGPLESPQRVDRFLGGQGWAMGTGMWADMVAV